MTPRAVSRLGRGVATTTPPAYAVGMRGITRRWKLAETHHPCDEHSLLERLLSVRGISEDEVEDFLKPTMAHTHDPGLLPGIDEAATMLVDAVRDDKSIVIYGDYDVDGISATSILWHVIKQASSKARLETYVPDRLDEGYGLNSEALLRFKEAGADLVISVDCGITAVDEVRAGRDAGLDIIITDHHNLRADGQLPDANAIVHPGLPGSKYPSRELCGAGVAFKLACRFARTWCGSEHITNAMVQVLTDVLPLTALGVIADVMPLTGENRAIVQAGLQRMRNVDLPGLQALIHASGLDGDGVDSDAVGFRLAPRINAAGRMGHALNAVELFTSANGERAHEIASELNALNTTRQKTEKEILAQAIEMAEAAGMTRPARRAIVLAHPDWHPGVIGIVCSRLVDRYGRPTILLQEQDGTCKGSARSIPGYSVHDGLEACSEFLETYGGHDAAAGLVLPSDRLQDFIEAFTTHANAAISEDDLVPWLVIDADATLQEIEQGNVGDLEQMAPFGRGNARPKVRLQGLHVEESKPMGNQSRHLSLQLAHAAGGRTVRAVWWNKGDLVDSLPRGTQVDLVARPKINSWKNRKTAELDIIDLDNRPGSDD